MPVECQVASSARLGAPHSTDFPLMIPQVVPLHVEEQEEVKDQINQLPKDEHDDDPFLKYANREKN